MTLHITFKDGTSKLLRPSDNFDWRETLVSLLLDENKVRPIRNFELMDNETLLTSGVFTLTGQLFKNK